MPEQPSVTEQQREAVQMFQKMFHRVRMWMREGSQESQESPWRSRKDAVCMHGRTQKSQLSSSGMQKREVQNMMVRTSSNGHA